VLFGHNLKDRKACIIELGGKKNLEIVTDMTLYNKTDVQIESCHKHTTYLLSYRPNARSFHWKNFKSARLSKRQGADSIIQLTALYRVKLNLRTHICNFDPINAAQSDSRFSIGLPKELRKTKIETFYPVMSQNETRIVIAIRFVNNLYKNFYEADKYSCFVLFDLDRQCSFQVDSQKRTFCGIWFETDDQVVL